MSNGAKKRKKVDGFRAYRMALDGMTVRQIAALLGWTEKRVTSQVKNAQKLIDRGIKE
jgi:DNA-binding CsgD family transcriptional regulator